MPYTKDQLSMAMLLREEFRALIGKDPGYIVETFLGRLNAICAPVKEPKEEPAKPRLGRRLRRVEGNDV